MSGVRSPKPVKAWEKDVTSDIIVAGIKAILARKDTQDARHGDSGSEKRNCHEGKDLAGKGSRRSFPHPDTGAAEPALSFEEGSVQRKLAPAQNAP